jgi:hypothetical protein
MGAAATLATGKLDLKSKSINYELLVSHMKIYGSFVLGKVTQPIMLLSKGLPAPGHQNTPCCPFPPVPPQASDTARLLQLTALDLSRNKLCSLPPELSLMTSLTELNCNDNWLKDLPMEMRSLTKLRNLYMKGNR